MPFFSIGQPPPARRIGTVSRFAAKYSARALDFEPPRFLGSIPEFSKCHHVIVVTYYCLHFLMRNVVAVPGCDREAISGPLSTFVRRLELGRMLHEYHLSKSSLDVMEDKLKHVRNNVNPALWAEMFQDDEDFYEAGYQPGDEVELFAAGEAGQAAEARLALLELAAAKAEPESHSLVSYSLTPPSSPSPAPPEDSPTADDLLEHAKRLQLQNFLQIAASDQSVAGECWPVRDRLIKRDGGAFVGSFRREAAERRTLLADLRRGNNKSW